MSTAGIPSIQIAAHNTERTDQDASSVQPEAIQTQPPTQLETGQTLLPDQVVDNRTETSDVIWDRQSLGSIEPATALIMKLEDNDETLTIPPINGLSRAASVLSSTAQKPKMVSGFYTEDSDEESGDTQKPVIGGTNGLVALESVEPAQQEVSSMAENTLHNLSVPATLDDSNAFSQVSPSTFSSAPPVQSNGIATAPVVESVKNLTGNDGNTVISAPHSPQMPSHSFVVQSVSSTSLSKRLPNDIVGQLEDRIAEDPKGDVEAWNALISYYKSKGKYDETRKVYGRFFDIFPTAADQWVTYARMELELDDLPRLEAIFNMSLLKVQSIPLWTIYLDHVRRRNDIATDASGQGRQIVSQAYEFVVNQVGNDKDSGSLWHDYIAFVKSGPGNLGGSGWQDAQKMDLLRKAYQRAICAPMSAVTSLWKEYDNFEMGLNKLTGRKLLQEKSPAYMTARSSFTALQTLTKDLRRGITPILPPHQDYIGYENYQTQISAWRRWIEWEKEDPLVLKDEDVKAFNQRILYVYRQAVMPLRFYPTIWFDAAQWCLSVGLDTEAIAFLDDGLQANPESVLLGLRKADYIEQTTPAENGEDSLVKRGQAVRVPIDGVLNSLYKHVDKLVLREKSALAVIEESYAQDTTASREPTPEQPDGHGEDDADGDLAKPLTRVARKESEITAVKANYADQIRVASRTITYLWIALMRAMRRIQGKGKPTEKVGGMRGVFKEARLRGRLLADCHAATALMEHHCYRDPAATKIFNLGMKLFPEDENFALEHIKFLISIGDSTNARAVFETTVARLTLSSTTIPRTKLLFAYFHSWESKFGELSQIAKTEKRMMELFPEDPLLSIFTQRFGANSISPPVFDPCSVELILSLSQIRSADDILDAIPTTEAAVPATEGPSFVQNGYAPSPKRPLDDSDAELPARKLIRGESPLKGAAGRRQQQQRQARELATMQQTQAPGVKPLPAAILHLLSVIPPARQWDQTRFEPSKMVELIQRVDMSKATLPGTGLAFSR